MNSVWALSQYFLKALSDYLLSFKVFQLRILRTLQILRLGQVMVIVLVHLIQDRPPKNS